MSLIVIYEGKRKVIKVASPNTLIQDIVVESAEHFSVDASKCVLKHKRNVIPNSQLFRFSNISNNAEVDLVVESTQNLAPCKIAVSVQDGQSVTKVTTCDCTLLNFLETLISDGTVSSNVLTANPEFIYMRNSYSGEMLQKTTLKSLGLAGQSVRFMLKFSNSQLISPLLNIPSPSIETALLDEVSSNTIVNENAKEESDTAVVGVSTAAASEMHVALASGIRSMDGDSTQPQLSQVIGSSGVGPVAESSSSSVLPVPVPATVVDILDSDSSAQIPHQPLDPSVALDKMITDNFDRITTPAVLTIAKYMNNILENPYNSKFRSINILNKVFQANVAGVNGSLEYLLSVGFVLDQGKHLLTYPVDADADCSILQKHRQQLDIAMDKLRIPPEQRPAVAAVKENTTPQPVHHFDPYKASIVRQAPQPIRSEASSTELRLEALRKKRAELEGSMDEVERLTEVIFPMEDGSVRALQQQQQASAQSELEIVDEIDESDPTMKNLVSRSIVNVMKNASLKETAPLTTSSMRAIKQMEKEKVYKRLLIRIRFPDKVCIQGYFHPRHTMSDVYAWLDLCVSAEFRTMMLESLRGDTLSDANHEISKKQKQQQGDTTSELHYCFELYQSPPHRALRQNLSEDLLTLHLAPAAVINLKWTSNDNLMHKFSPGSYLSDDISSHTTDNKSDSMNVCRSAFPIGLDLEPVSQDSSSKQSSGSSLPNSSISAQSTTDKSSNNKESWKPKWFKVGK